MIPTGSNSGLLLENDGEQHEAVAQRAGHDDAVEAGVLVGSHVVEGDATLTTEVAWVGAGTDGTDRHHETQSIGRGHLAGAPGADEIDVVLCSDQTWR